MAARLTKENMSAIYESSKKVFDQKTSVKDAIAHLRKILDSSEASIKMYFNIYAAMRKGTVYKMGTGEEFTKFLLESILKENGEEAFKLALSAVKKNSEYRESVNNAQPGLKRACKEAIADSGLAIEYDELSGFLSTRDASSPGARMVFAKGQVTISPEDSTLLTNSINEQISKFASDIMTVLSKYQLLDNEQIAMLTDRDQCRNIFKSDYAMLLEVSDDKSDIDRKIHDSSGHTRYYGTVYNFNGHFYVMTSQLYGPGGTHKDNKTPFYEWVLDIAGIDWSDVSEHPLGEFYSWEILSKTTAVKHCDKSFFEHNGSGVPKEICWFFDADNLDIGEAKQVKLLYADSDFMGRIANDTTDRHRIRIFWNTDLGKQFSQYQNKENIQARFEKLSDNVYEISFIEEEKEVTFSVSDYIEKIKTYIASEGFNYEDGLIENFYLSLKSKPFVILAGTSGTGKTRLVKLFSKAVGATTENGHFKMVSVRPDWSDSTDLFGHVDLNGKFVSGVIIDFVKRAEVDNNHPYFLCLDEMNLARVEYYLSDILSIIETRELKNGNIISDPLLSNTYYGTDQTAAGKYGTVRLPENLYLIGTVNMDETTFPFSRKVLDRANTIEFSYVDLLPNFDERSTDSPVPLNLENAFLKTEYLLLKQCADESDAVNEYCSELQQINRILQKASAHVGYRVRDEIVFYLLNNKKYGLLSENEAMDNELMQKILPRIQGSSISVKNMLCDLFKHCAGDYDGYQTQNDDVSSKMMKAAGAASVKYPRSAEKIAFMVRRFEEDGFTSYWL